MTVWAWPALALGGALGAMARFALSHQLYLWLGRDFAWGTLGVNVLGSLVMGFLSVLLIDKWALSIEWRLFLLVGFLGAFTTFSTFSFETLQYLQVGELAKAFWNMALNVLLTVAAVWVGLVAGRALLSL
ncbi:MAG: fluoride efflux transporter CrcB [Thiotrichales bacterium]|nr:fluoride efflux transporter CrcB [Thiotrichales bacterium]